MRVLQVHTRYRQPGGEDSVVDDEHQLLIDGGHAVERLLFTNPMGSIRSAATLLAAPWNRKGHRALLDVVESFRPDVVHFHNNWFNPGPSFLRALDRTQVARVVTLHNYRLLCVNAMLYRDGSPCIDCVGRAPWPGVVHRCYRESFGASAVAAVATTLHQNLGTWEESVDLFIALTEFARQIHASGGLSADQIAVRPNFVRDPGRRGSTPSDSDSLLFAGRLNDEKGLESVLIAWRDADPRGLQLLVAGDGPARPGLEAGSPEGVRFLGQLPYRELSALMLRSRALLMPSKWYEGQPRVLLEAMASGLPPAVSRLGGLPETVGPGLQALLVDPGDLNGWVRVLAALADDGLVDRCGREARSVYEEAYSPKQALPSLEAIYQRAIDSRR